MSYYKTRLEADLQNIRDRLTLVSDTVGVSIETVVDAIMKNDKESLYKVMLKDPQVNRETRAIDSFCHAFIARHLPAAKHLRFVSSALRLSIALERIGDYSVTMARIGVRLKESPPAIMMDDLVKVSARSCKMLNRAIKSFVTEDANLAQETALMSRKVDKRHDKFFNKAINEENPVLLRTVRLLNIMSKLERVSDQAKNMCEEALFVTTGEIKVEKTPKILFVDEKNNLYSQLAVLLAQKSFPNSGQYSSSGWLPAETISPNLTQAVEQFGLDADAFSIKAVKPFRQIIAKYTVIVAINGGEEPPLTTIPFYSILLKWEIDETLPIEEVVRILASNINELMITLIGPSAD